MALSKAEVRKVGKELDFAIETKAKELGISVDKGCGGRYSASTGEITFRFSVTVPVEGAEEAKYSHNERDAILLGLNKKVGDTFRSYIGKHFKITGINLRRHKYPVSADCVITGKGYKFPVQEVNVASIVNSDGSLTKPDPQSVLASL